jgi:hypothetical protein
MTRQNLMCMMSQCTKTPIVSILMQADTQFWDISVSSRLAVRKRHCRSNIFSCCVTVISAPPTSTSHLWWLSHMMRSSNVPYEIDGFTVLYSAAQSLCSPRMHKRPGTNISASVTSTTAAFPEDMSHKLICKSKILRLYRCNFSSRWKWNDPRISWLKTQRITCKCWRQCWQLQGCERFFPINTPWHDAAVPQVQ